MSYAVLPTTNDLPLSTVRLELEVQPHLYFGTLCAHVLQACLCECCRDAAVSASLMAGTTGSSREGVQ